MRNARVSLRRGRRAAIVDRRLEGAAEAVAGRILERLERDDGVAAGGPRFPRHELPARVGDVDRHVAVDRLAAGGLDADRAERQRVVERGRQAQHDRVARAGDGRRDLPRTRCRAAWSRRRRRGSGARTARRAGRRAHRASVVAITRR